MKIMRNIIVSNSAILSACMLLYASGIALFLPGVFWSQHPLLSLLLILLPLPAITAAILWKAMSSYAGKPGLFSTRDPLTNLYNKTVFWDYLGYETERSKRQNYRFSLLCLDLDDFKAVNDLHGHEVGDEILLEFSGLFKDAVRKGDIAARYGGDNFAAILPICDEAQAYIVAKRMMESIRAHSFAHSDRNILLTASIGISTFPDHAKDAQDLYLLADGMLTHAKAAGKNRMSMPDDGFDADILKSAGKMSLCIIEAIRKKQVVPFFQPIICMNDQTRSAYEVLTRIVTPEAIIPAAEFIEQAEGMGAIGKIDHLIMEQAFALAKQNRFQGKLFINLSPKALIHDEFMPTVRKQMRDYGIEPSNLVFEITERDTVKNLNLIEKNVCNLKQEGFQFAIDDFGSGYSSFLYIKMFQVDYLKIDGEFIRNMIGTGTENAIVSHITALAGSLGIKTVAEHVESEAILNNVRSIGIDCAQGYFIQRPGPDLTPLIFTKR
jgi:diguanylate cyclase (GGDEF)-like protein